MEEKILEVINDYKKATEKECYAVKYVDELTTILDDKIGGLPYLPVGVEYPKDKNNNPMALLIQINLDNLELKNYPKGILEVFITTDIDEIYENMELPKDCYTFKLFESGLEYQTDLPQINVDNFIYKKPIKLIFSKQKTFKPYNFCDDETINLLLELLRRKFSVNLEYPTQMEELLNIDYDDLTDKINEEYNTLCNIGGYPFFINEPDNDYYDSIECLMYIISSINLGFCLGADAGSFYGLILKEDLINRNFDDALLKIQF